MSETDAMERRVVEAAVEVRRRDGKPVIVGRIPYNSLSSDLGGFQERLAPGCFGEHLRSKPDIPAKYDHGKRGMGLPLGRTGNGTLRLDDTPASLNYEIDPPETTEARDLLVSAERQDTKGTSFGFVVEPGGEHWSRESGVPIREIRKARLTEVSPTPDPAYPESTIAVARRSLEAFQEEEQRAMSELVEPTIKPGHFVKFMHADGTHSAHQKVGRVVETRSDGRLKMPGHEMYLEGTRSNPAHLVAEYRAMNDGDEDDRAYYRSGHMHLVEERRLEKMDGPEPITDEQAKAMAELLQKHEEEEMQGRRDRLRMVSIGPTMDSGDTLGGGPSYE